MPFTLQVAYLVPYVSLRQSHFDTADYVSYPWLLQSYLNLVSSFMRLEAYSSGDLVLQVIVSLLFSNIGLL